MIPDALIYAPITFAFAYIMAYVVVKELSRELHRPMPEPRAKTVSATYALVHTFIAAYSLGYTLLDALISTIVLAVSIIATVNIVKELMKAFGEKKRPPTYISSMNHVDGRVQQTDRMHELQAPQSHRIHYKPRNKVHRNHESVS